MGTKYYIYKKNFNNLFFFQSDKSTRQKQSQSTRRCSTKFPFATGHPSVKTHGHQKRPHICWPIYRAQRLPDTTDLQEDSDLQIEERYERREKYGQAALIIFFPFRDIEDLRDPSTFWWDSYLKRKTTLDDSAKTKEIIHNIQNYYESFCRTRMNGHEPDFTNTNPHQMMHLDDFEKEQENLIDLQNAEIEIELAESQMECDEQENDPFVMKLALLNETAFILNDRENQNSISQSQAVQAMETLRSNSSRTSILQELVTPLENTQPTNSQYAKDLPVLDTPTGTRVQLMEHIEQALKMHAHRSTALTAGEPAQLNADFPTLQQHSSHWTLNKKQHAGFTLIATALLQHISVANELEEDHRVKHLPDKIRLLFQEILPATQQLLMYLGGSGGTGKSRVIQAVVDFARRWHSSSAIVICASCGAAAVLIGGCTLHSALGIHISLNPPDPTEEQILAWSHIGVLFIDEFSMINPALFDLTDSRLRKLKGRLDLPFGGIHVVFCGDFYQLPPIGACIYKPPTASETSQDNHAIATMRGIQLWKDCLSDAIELTENHRQADPKWAASLERWRVNQPTAQTLKKLMLDSSRTEPVLCNRHLTQS